MSSASGAVSTTVETSVSEVSATDVANVQPEALTFQSTGSAPPQLGHASWYAHKFQGRRTANGERYDGRALTAAHRTLPFGTYVRVTSLSTSKSIVVRINDRGPFVKGRIIDLSYAAANALGLTRAPSMSVQIECVASKAERDDDI